MTNEHGKQLQEAGPATPVEILGLNEVPERGRSACTPSRTRRRRRRSPRAARGRWRRASSRRRPRCRSRSSRSASPRAGSRSCASSSRATCRARSRRSADALVKLSDREGASSSIINAAVGAITEGDVNLAIASKAIIVGFNVRPAGKASVARRREQDRDPPLLDHLQRGRRRSRGDGRLAASRRSSRRGTARPRSAQLFKVKGVAVAGCFVIEGKIVRARQDAPPPRRRGRLGRQGRQPQALQGRRARSPRGLRVRHQPRGLQRHQGEGHSRVATRSRRSSRSCKGRCLSEFYV